MVALLLPQHPSPSSPHTEGNVVCTRLSLLVQPPAQSSPAAATIFKAKPPMPTPGLRASALPPHTCCPWTLADQPLATSPTCLRAFALARVRLHCSPQGSAGSLSHPRQPPGPARTALREQQPPSSSIASDHPSSQPRRRLRLNVSRVYAARTWLCCHHSSSLHNRVGECSSMTASRPISAQPTVSQKRASDTLGQRGSWEERRQCGPAAAPMPVRTRVPCTLQPAPRRGNWRHQPVSSAPCPELLLTSLAPPRKGRHRGDCPARPSLSCPALRDPHPPVLCSFSAGTGLH